ncbi:hypothetical protein, partial [Burkholderia multivorans]|uniref:hypothetical protein n=1 Tax=Burkholderia multivorans TaxID=87883 RepID=UPI00195530FD
FVISSLMYTDGKYVNDPRVSRNRISHGKAMTQVLLRHGYIASRMLHMLVGPRLPPNGADASDARMVRAEIQLSVPQ